MKIQVTPVGVVSRSCWRAGSAGTTSDWSIAKAPPARARTARMRPGRAATRGASCAATDRTYHKRSVPSASPAPVDRPLRRDARENRDRVLAAAGRPSRSSASTRASRRSPAGRAWRGDALPPFPDERRAARRGLRGSSRPYRSGGRAGGRGRRPLGGAGRLPGVRRRPAGGRPGLSEILGANLRTEQLLGRARKRLRPLVERSDRSSPGVRRAPFGRRLRGHLGAPLDDRARRRRDARRRSPTSGSGTSRSLVDGLRPAARRPYRSHR